MKNIKFSELYKITLKNGLNRPTKDRGSGYKMVNMGEIFAHDRLFDIDMERVSVSEKEKHYFLEEGDLLFARQSLVLSGAGKCSIYMGASEQITFEGHIIRVRLDKAIVEPLYYYYYFKSQEGRSNIETIIEQVSAAGIRGSDLSNLVVPFPPLETQKEIAHILGTLDDKIELNRKMNKTLEEIAQTLYKHWFIDFEFPNADGKPYKSSGGEMIDSVKGLIPKEWRVGKLRDLCEKAQYGYTTSATDVNTGVRFLRITDINKEPWIEWSRVPFCEVTPTDLQKYKLMKGDIVIARMADPGQNAFIENEVDAVFASYLIRFKPKLPGYGRYLQYWLRNDDFWDQVLGSSMGTTRVSLNAESLSTFQVVIPEHRISTLFTQIIQECRQLTGRNTYINDLLGTIMISMINICYPHRSL